MRKLVIAEKPSLARKIVEALTNAGEKFKRIDGGEYFLSENYAVTSQFGHMLELKDINDYAGNEGRDMWKSSNLPFFPSRYEYVVKESVERRYETIKNLLAKTDEFDEVLHCGDPDREGQILVDLVLISLECKLPVTRPILKTLTDEAIIKAFNERKPNLDYRNWRNEGLLRMYIDNDYGKNLSRYATAKTSANPALNVGRVKGAIANELYERELAIENFVPEIYYKVESSVDGMKLTSRKEFDKDHKEDAEKYAKLLNEAETKVKSVTRKKTEKKRPKLFSQTDLQSRMNKLYNMPPDRTLELSQSLYEKGLLSYPRTNTEYMTTGEKDEVKAIINAHNDKGLMKFRDDKTIFDDSKIDGHSAITPTTKHISDVNVTEDEKKCYMAVAARFMAVFCDEPCVYDRTQVTLENSAGEEFKISGEMLVTSGWQKFEKPDKKDNILPDLQKGQVVDTSFEAIESQTKPPRRYTVDTLGKWMQNPFRKELSELDEDADDAEMYKNIRKGLEIGTEATRSGILSTLIEKKYISLDKTTYGILPRGRFLVDTCRNLGIDMSKEATARLGAHTKAVYNGEEKVSDVLTGVRQEISGVISAGRTTPPDSEDYGSRHVILGYCPRCGSPVVEGKKAFGCTSWREKGCRFTIWKTVSGKEMNAELVKVLLKDRKAERIGGFINKDGKMFSAVLELDSRYGIVFKDMEEEVNG